MSTYVDLRTKYDLGVRELELDGNIVEVELYEYEPGNYTQFVDAAKRIFDFYGLPMSIANGHILVPDGDSVKVLENSGFITRDSQGVFGVLNPPFTWHVV